MHVLANITRDHSQDLQSGVWEPGHSAFSPQWCLVAALLVGVLCTQNLMALDRGLTPPKKLLSAFPKLKSTLQSQAFHRQRL